jgi:hypothetical protein
MGNARPHDRRKLRQCGVCFEPKRGDGDLEHGEQPPGTRIWLYARRHDRLPSVSDHESIAGLKVGAGCSRRLRSSPAGIDRSAL